MFLVFFELFGLLPSRPLYFLHDGFLASLEFYQFLLICGKNSPRYIVDVAAECVKALQLMRCQIALDENVDRWRIGPWLQMRRNRIDWFLCEIVVGLRGNLNQRCLTRRLFLLIHVLFGVNYLLGHLELSLIAEENVVWVVLGADDFLLDVDISLEDVEHPRVGVCHILLQQVFEALLFVFDLDGTLLLLELREVTFTVDC